MTINRFNPLASATGIAGTRRTMLRALGASTLAAGTGLAGLSAAEGKSGKKRKRKRKKQQPQPQTPPAAGTLEACQAAIECLVNDPICLTSRDQCCAILAAGQTTDAVQCIIAAATARC